MINNNGTIITGVTTYKELIKIIKHAEFKHNEVSNNIISLKYYHNELLLLPIKSHSVKITSKQTPSTAKPNKDVYYF